MDNLSTGDLPPTNPTLAQLRADLDDYMEFSPDSPLGDEQRENFSGLKYYPENPDLVFVGPVQRFPDDAPPFQMETSTGDTRLFRPWGTFAFTVDGEQATLTIYSDPSGDDLFLPYRDATSGHETYGAGRYLDSHRPGLALVGEDELELDFNFAYNPYCAYSPYYNCPLPPRENWLKVSIRAGEKTFAG